MRTVYFFGNDVYFLLIYVALIVFVAHTSGMNSFVRGVLLTFCGMRIASTILGTLLFQLEVEVTKEWFGAGAPLYFVRVFLYPFGTFLLLFAVTLFVGRPYPVTEADAGPRQVTGERRHIGVSLLLFVITAGWDQPFWLYRTVRDLRDNFPEKIRYTPGVAVGLHFVPLFNLFWWVYVQYSLALAITRIEAAHFGRHVGFHFPQCYMRRCRS